MLIKRLLPLFIFCWVFCTSSLAETPSARHPLDESVTRRFVLENGLRVLLVFDPKFNKSAAALDVGVGSLNDPDTAPGLAHFLEHMLFLGTEKYPDVEEYGRFLKTNGGYSNAYTAWDHTNYHFEVRHQALEGALDRFAQFFIAPLFNPEFTERERNAVNSEHEKNRLNDEWRQYQMFNNFYREDHPANHFATGTLETLKDVTPAVLRRFYETHYSAEIMSLVVLSKLDLDRMERMVRERFSSIPNRGIPLPRFDTDYLEPVTTARIIQVRPVKELRELEIEFALPSIIPWYRAKPGEMIGFLLGYEGENSLVSLLKNKGWISSLSAGSYASTRDFASFNISVSLTPEGMSHYKEILNDIFGYIHLIHQFGLPRYVFDEVQTMKRLEFLYSDKGEGAERASHLAKQLLRYPIDIADRVDYIIEDYDSGLFQSFLGFLKPSNSLMMLTAPDVPVTDTDPIYGTEYSYFENTPLFRDLLAAQPPIETKIPAPNPFLPRDISLLPEQPIKIVDRQGVKVYYLQDNTFKRPKLYLAARIRYPRSHFSLKDAVMRDFYTAAVRESLNEILYTSSLAGLDFSIGNSLEGITLQVSGYNDAADTLLNIVLPYLNTIKLGEDRFASVKDSLVRNLKNFEREQPWSIARTRSRQIFWKHFYSPEEKLPVAEAVTLRSLRRYAKRLFSRGFLEVLVYGNCTAEKARHYAELIRKDLSLQPLSRDLTFEQEYRTPSELPREPVTEEVKSNNSVYRGNFILGPSTARNRVIGRFIDLVLKQPYYTEMRTKQQLGYIVWSGLWEDKKLVSFVTIIQSGVYPARELADRSDSFLENSQEIFDSLSDTEFEQIRDSLAEQLREQDKSIAEKGGRFFELAFDYDEDFGRKVAELSQLQTVSRKEVRQSITNLFYPPHRKEIRQFLDATIFSEK